MASWLPYVAVVVSVLAFLASQREVRRMAKVDYVKALETRIADCEEHREELRQEVRKLRNENIDLLRRVVRLEE